MTKDTEYKQKKMDALAELETVKKLLSADETVTLLGMHYYADEGSGKAVLAQVQLCQDISA